jgi:hypothetical protein
VNSVDDATACTVFSAGLAAGVFARADVIAWADLRIAEREIPERWLIELAMSHELTDAQLAELLEGPGVVTDAEQVVRCGLALIAADGPRDVATARRQARAMYRFALTAHGRRGVEWTPLVSRASGLDDEFALMDGGYRSEPEKVAAQVWEMVDECADPAVARSLAPVRWAIATEGESTTGHSTRVAGRGRGSAPVPHAPQMQSARRVRVLLLVLTAWLLWQIVRALVAG